MMYFTNQDLCSFFRFESDFNLRSDNRFRGPPPFVPQQHPEPQEIEPVLPALGKYSFSSDIRTRHYPVASQERS
jgi:hypothetical protein